MVSLPQNGDFKEYSQADAKTLFVSGKFPVFSGFTWTTSFHLAENHGVGASIQMDEL